ncbi:retroelement silencing factor 1 isoform X2 [Manis pentadactyla]|uniref:retroelement silencing factor 1 isoform X2 n=1 Tax=Manis pentadactyla TaxID=143292 RepID=UPI00255D02D9|nr:retroelement silencing factor 1 isoform X2 [Manis pentadactyla]
MNWNGKPDSVTLPPQYPKNQSCFLEQTFINTLNPTSQSSSNYLGSNQEACMFLSSSNPVSQPLLNIRNYKTAQQIPISDMHSGTIMAPQTSAERRTYANVKGPKQLNHNMQMNSGVTQNVWLNSPMMNSVLPHTGTTVSQTAFGNNTSNVHGLQNQFVTSDSYSMKLQVVPSNSVRVPVSYQGNTRLNPTSSERQVDWTQQYMSSGVTYPDNRRVPKQYSYSSRSVVHDPALQKQKPVLPTSLQVKTCPPPESGLSLQSKQIETVQSYRYGVTHTDKRPPPPPYDCRYVSQPLQSTQHIDKHSTVEVPQSQGMPLPEMRKDFCRGFQQQWQNINEDVGVTGNVCNLKINSNVSPLFNEPIRPSVDSVQTFAQNNQEKRVDSCNLTSNQVLDTSVAKEKLVRDIKTLVEIKRKFSELARKIKINKDLLMAAGCIKPRSTTYSESAQKSELSLNQSAKIQPGPQVTLVTPETAVDKPPTVMENAEEITRTQSTVNSNNEDPNRRNSNHVNSVTQNSVCPEKLPAPNQLHDLKVMTSSKTSSVEIIQATLSNTQFSSGSFVNVELNVPANLAAASVPQPTPFEEYSSKYPNKNRLILSLLTHEGQTQKKLLKDASETIQVSKTHNFEITPNTHITGDQLSLNTMKTPSTCNINANISDSSVCLEHKPSTNEMSSKSSNHCSMELLATCLSLWKTQPSEPTEEKQCNESKANRAAVGISKLVDICDKSPFSVVGNYQNKMANGSQETNLSVVAQNYEPSGTIMKGTELQVAVVSPLILSDTKTSARGAPDTLPETIYPVIKEGSVCSLQNALSEKTRVTAALKVNESVPSITSTKIFPLMPKDKQNESPYGNSEGAPNNRQGKLIKSEPDPNYPLSDQQDSHKSRDTDSVSGGILQIDSICSLVEGDTSYNIQIAEIFNSPSLKMVEPQKPLPSHQEISSQHQKEQLDNITENKDFGFQRDTCVQSTDVSHRVTDQSESLQLLESHLKCDEGSGGITEDSSLEHITKKESTAKGPCSSAANQQDSYPQEIGASCNYTAQDLARNEILNEKTPILYLHDQLSELLKEFPYGIEPVNTHEGSVAQQESSKGQTCDKTSCDSKSDSAEKIKITILSSEQMKELFPEQEYQPCKADELTEPHEENPVTEGSQCDPQIHIKGEGHDSVILDSEKDDVRCCALGWLSMVYEGVPQCQCNSIKSMTSKEEKGKDERPPLETSSRKQGKKTSDKDIPTGLNSPPTKSLEVPLTSDRKKRLPEAEQGKALKDRAKTKHSHSLRTEQELCGQFLSKGDNKKLDSLPSHKQKGKLQFHEVTFHSSNKMTKFSQESLQRKRIAHNSRPLKAKTGFLTSKNKDLPVKSGSLMQAVPSEKRKLKTGDSKQKVLEKRKLEKGSVCDSEIKRKRCDGREQSKNAGGSIFKLRNFLSIPNERGRLKEKTVSNVKSSGSQESSNKNRVLTPKEYLQRQKHKDTMGSRASKKNYLKNEASDSQFMRCSNELPIRIGSYGKSNERDSSVQTSKEPISICTSHGKNPKVHHSEGSAKSLIMRNTKATDFGKQPNKMRIEKTKSEKSLNNVNNVECSRISKDQRKLYLNRVAFKCTERESICLTKLDCSPRKLNKERRPENKPNSLLPVSSTIEKLSLLEFKLCPDGVFKNTVPAEQRKDLQPCPQKEPSSVRDDNVLANKRLSKRSFSADGFETLQNPVRDSKAMFQTYKKMYMEKKSRSLSSSPST